VIAPHPQPLSPNKFGAREASLYEVTAILSSGKATAKHYFIALFSIFSFLPSCPTGIGGVPGIRDSLAGGLRAIAPHPQPLAPNKFGARGASLYEGTAILSSGKATAKHYFIALLSTFSFLPACPKGVGVVPGIRDSLMTRLLTNDGSSLVTYF
jgi:hypothetical protein